MSSKTDPDVEPLDWSALWSAMRANYDSQSAEWTETTEHMFDEMLSVLPPKDMRCGSFLVGEAWNHNSEGQAVYAAFREIPCNRFEARYMTLREFREKLL